MSKPQSLVFHMLYLQKSHSADQTSSHSFESNYIRQLQFYNVKLVLFSHISSECKRLCQLDSKLTAWLLDSVIEVRWFEPLSCQRNNKIVALLFLRDEDSVTKATDVSQKEVSKLRRYCDCSVEESQISSTGFDVSRQLQMLLCFMPCSVDHHK